MKNGQEKIELLWKIFDNQQNLISNADTKASISIGIQTFILTTILGASIINKTFIEVLQQRWLIIAIYLMLFIVFLLTSVFSLAHCIFAFCPRLPQENKELTRSGISYFGHISKYDDSNSYLQRINEIDLKDILNELACQNYNLARILNKKMASIKKSTNNLFANIMTGILLLGISLLLN